VVKGVLTTPACFQLEPATVEVAEILGLNATFENQFERLSGALAEHTRQVAPPRRVYINLTGGFKGTVPFLTQLAWTHGYALYYQHEAQSKSEIVELAGTRVAPDAQPTVTLVSKPARFRRQV
jgi:CRISPR/Cas system-associated protein Csm6